MPMPKVMMLTLNKMDAPASVSSRMLGSGLAASTAQMRSKPMQPPGREMRHLRQTLTADIAFRIWRQALFFIADEWTNEVVRFSYIIYCSFKHRRAHESR
jgi:hypothetical protein